MHQIQAQKIARQLFPEDGRTMIRPRNVMPGTMPMRVRAKAARDYVERVLTNPNKITTHSPHGATLWIASVLAEVVPSVKIVGSPRDGFVVEYVE
jgi:hypothetical protein